MPQSSPLSDLRRSELIAAREDFADLYISAPCGYLLLMADGMIIHANRRIAEWTGHSADELPGRQFQELLTIAARIFYETNVSPLLRLQGFVDELAMDFQTKSGTKMQSLVNASERRDDTGKVLFIRLAIFRAIERRRYERALVDANESMLRAAAAEREVSKLREQFIAVLGHDLRNPLAAISSGVRLLAQREALSASGTQVLSLMQGSVSRASELIENVLDFARGRLAGGMALTRDALAPLSPVLEHVVAELASVHPQRSIHLELKIDDPVDCDRGRLAQLVSNLVGNALTHGSPNEPIHLKAWTEPDRLSISVTNGGRPIDEATIERLFQPFFRGDGKTAGLGLGLHIASEIAKAHDGSLAVRSDSSGTEFVFTMPLGVHETSSTTDRLAV